MILKVCLSSMGPAARVPRVSVDGIMRCAFCNMIYAVVVLSVGELLEIRYDTEHSTYMRAHAHQTRLQTFQTTVARHQLTFRSESVHVGARNFRFFS